LKIEQGAKLVLDGSPFLATSLCEKIKRRQSVRDYFFFFFFFCSSAPYSAHCGLDVRAPPGGFIGHHVIVVNATIRKSLLSPIIRKLVAKEKKRKEKRERRERKEKS